MKKYLLLIFLLVSSLASFCQTPKIESFRQTNDAIASVRNVQGTDGNVCAAVIVRIPVSNASFSGGFIIGTPTYQNGEYIIDMQQGAAQMRVSVPGYNTMDVNFRDYIGSTLRSKTTYMLTVSLPQSSAQQQQKKQTLNIKVSPPEAIVQIDGEVIEETHPLLTVGTHRYNVVAKGYYSQEGAIEIKENSPAKLLIELDRKANSSQTVAQAATNPVQTVQQPTTVVQHQPVYINTLSAPSAQTFTVNGVSFTMMPVEGGTFTMGATPEMTDPWDREKPTHQVTLSSYYIGETEVTQELWQAVMGSNPSAFKGKQNPVEHVSWDDCQKFITKLNQATGKKFRLPTEAEWEFAARGGNKSRHTQYSGSSNIDEVAWYDKNSSDKGSSSPDYGTRPVKQKQANELGIYDMTGNVWEWCQDRYGDYGSSAQTNPAGPTSGSCRVNRGGSWYSNARICRISVRSIWAPDGRFYYLGLRLAISE